MKKILSVFTCGILAACACNESQWEQVEVVSLNEVGYEQKAEVKNDVVIQVEPTPVLAQQEVKACPCAQVQPCQMTPCCQAHVAPAPQPKVTTTKKIITTTTTLEEPCGKPVCEPVVTVHEEIISSDDATQENKTITEAEVTETTNLAQEVNSQAEEEIAVVENVAPVQVEEAVNENKEYVKVTVNKNPYHSKIVDMRNAAAPAVYKDALNYSPEVYTVVATRATNRMLQDTAVIHENGVKRIYIKDVNVLSSDLPYGSHRIKGATRDIIVGSKIYDVVNNIKNADLVVEPSVDWFVTASSKVPALQYKMTLSDSNGKKVDEWIEVIRQVKE